MDNCCLSAILGKRVDGKKIIVAGSVGVAGREWLPMSESVVCLNSINQSNLLSGGIGS